MCIAGLLGDAVRYHRRLPVNGVEAKLECRQQKSPAKTCEALAFGIDRNQESFLRKMKIPADAAKAAVSCKNFLCFFSLGL